MKIESIATKLLKLIIEKSDGNDGPFLVGLSGGGREDNTMRKIRRLINK